MSAGIPGIGLGGLFFVISAFMMVFVELWLTLRGRSSLARWRLVLSQCSLAAGIVAATVGLFWLLDFALLSRSPVVRAIEARKTTGVGGDLGDSAVEALLLLPISAAPILVTLVLLLCVLCLAEVARWFVRRPELLAGGRSRE